jgi:hypothetical protein
MSVACHPILYQELTWHGHYREKETEDDPKRHGAEQLKES